VVGLDRKTAASLYVYTPVCARAPVCSEYALFHESVIGDYGLSRVQGVSITANAETLFFFFFFNCV
jgi:hypothetical protein